MAPATASPALANEFRSGRRRVLSALIELGLILFLITTVVLAFSKLLLMQLAKSEGTRTERGFFSGWRCGAGASSNPLYRSRSASISSC
jgi:hypothetical protein